MALTSLENLRVCDHPIHGLVGGLAGEGRFDLFLEANAQAECSWALRECVVVVALAPSQAVAIGIEGEGGNHKGVDIGERDGLSVGRRLENAHRAHLQVCNRIDTNEVEDRPALVDSRVHKGCAPLPECFDKRSGIELTANRAVDRNDLPALQLWERSGGDGLGERLPARCRDLIADRSKAST
jgi:hypothetical protein